MDLAFCSYHENSQNHWIPFLEDEIWAVVPDGHPLAGCEELSLAQLASEPFILEDRAYDYDISRVIQEAGVHPNVRWTSKDEPGHPGHGPAGAGRLGDARSLPP